MRTFAIVNQKGGCGKTTTSINVAAVYARKGLRTLLIDMDPQSHCAAGLGVPEEQIERHIGDAMIAPHDASLETQSYLWEITRNLHLAPSTMMLSALGSARRQTADYARSRQSAGKFVVPLAMMILIDVSSIVLPILGCSPTTPYGLQPRRSFLWRLATFPCEVLGGKEKQSKRLIARIGKPLPCRIIPSIHRPSPLARKVLASTARIVCARSCTDCHPRSRNTS